MLAAPDTASGTEAAARLTEWARHRSTSARGRRQRRQATILARDVLALLGGVRSCCLLDAEHGPYASDADALCDFLRGGEHSSGTGAAEELCALQVLGITFVASATETEPAGEAPDALFVVHRSRLAARCASANSGASAGNNAGTWGGTAIVDATPCPGGGSQVAPRLCRDASVADGLRCGVQVVAAALASRASSAAPGYTHVRINLHTTSPTLLTAWLLEYPVGYYVAQPATSNILGGEELVVFSVRAELAMEGSQPVWLQLDAPNGLPQASTLCSFSVPLGLLAQEQAIGDTIQSWVTRIGAVLAPPAADASEINRCSACCVWRSPCMAKPEASDASFSEQIEEPVDVAGGPALLSQLELLPWLRTREGVVLDQVAL